MSGIHDIRPIYVKTQMCSTGQEANGNRPYEIKRPIYVKTQMCSTGQEVNGNRPYEIKRASLTVMFHGADWVFPLKHFPRLGVECGGALRASNAPRLHGRRRCVCVSAIGPPPPTYMERLCTGSVQVRLGLEVDCGSVRDERQGSGLPPPAAVEAAPLVSDPGLGTKTLGPINPLATLRRHRKQRAEILGVV